MQLRVLTLLIVCVMTESISETSAAPSVDILQWYCRNLHTNIDLFKQHISTNKYHIICLQSIGRKPNDLPALEGFYYPPFYKVRRDGAVAVATYVCADLRTQAVPTPCNKDTLAVCVQIIINNRKTNILNVYYPVGCTGRSDWLTKLSPEADW
jgi:hypothetical protein